jgi:ABC-type glycerol-3-phosphate transport system substrate-binding protein
MPRWKTALSAAIAGIVLAAGLAACGSGSGAGVTTVTFWTHTHPPMIALNKKIIAEYEKKHPNIKIDYQTIPNDEFGTKMLTSMSNGTGPDLLNMDDSALRGEYIPKRLLAPMDPAAFGGGSVAAVKGKYNPGTLGGATGDDGTLYGVPSEFNATAFAINTKHFTDAGLDPNKPPTTWDEVATDSKKLAAVKHTQAFSFLYLHSGWYTQQLQTLLNQTGGKIADAKHQNSTITSPASLAALSIWVQLATGPNRTADPNKSSREATAPFSDLATGRQSMAIVYPWAMEQIRQSNPDVYKQLKVVPLPQVNPASPVGRWYGYYWCVNGASKHQKEAWSFISYLSSQHDRWLTDVDFIQPLTGWETSAAGKSVPALPVWSAAYQNGKFDEVAPHYAEIQDALTAMVNDAVFNGITPQKAAEKASAQIQRSLGS